MESKEQQSTSTKTRRGRNWRARYLTRDEFWQWVANHFVHVKVKVDILLWLAGATILVVLGILGTLIAAVIQKLI